MLKGENCSDDDGKRHLLHHSGLGCHGRLCSSLIEAPVRDAMRRHDWRLLYVIKVSELQTQVLAARYFLHARCLTVVRLARPKPAVLYPNPEIPQGSVELSKMSWKECDLQGAAFVLGELACYNRFLVVLHRDTHNRRSAWCKARIWAQRHRNAFCAYGS